MKKIIHDTLIIFLFLCFCIGNAYAEEADGLGQTIQIYTRLHSFVGNPSWLLVVRDLDHGQTIPYLFDINRGNNFWLLFTYGKNYLITASNLQFSPYRNDPYNTKRLTNFCSLESHGRIIHRESMIIRLEGNLTPNSLTSTCQTARFADTAFTMGAPTTQSDE